MLLRIIESLLLGFFSSLILAVFDPFGLGKIDYEGWAVLTYIFLFPVLAVPWYFILKLIFRNEEVISKPINWIIFIPAWILSFWVLLTYWSDVFFPEKWFKSNLPVRFLRDFRPVLVLLPFVIIIILSGLIAWFVAKLFKSKK